MKQNSRKKVNILILFVYLIALFFLFNIFSLNKSDLVVGEVSLQNVVSKVDFENEVATELQRKQSRNSVSIVYKVLPNISIEKKDLILEFGETLKDLQERTDLNDTNKLQYLCSASKIPLSEENYSFLLSLRTADIDKIISISNDLINSSYSRGIRDVNLENEKNNILASVDELESNDTSAQIIKEIVSYTLIPNEVVDEERTEDVKNAAASQVKPVMIKAGDTVVLAGEVITPEKADLIIKSGNTLGTSGSKTLNFLKQIVLILIPTLLWVTFIYNIHQTVYLSNRYLILIIANLLLVIGAGLLKNVSILIVPIISLGLISSIYIDESLTIPNIIYVISLLVIFFNIRAIDIIYYVLAVIPIVIYSYRFYNRSYVFSISILASVLAATVYNIFIMETLNGFDIALNYVYAIISGILSSILAIGSGILWENSLNILTMEKLNELMDTNNLLLKELLAKAPGTYQHSLMVANLAENAAKKVSADYTLTKVGALYHDIGKTLNPTYFKENQLGIENPHNKLEPAESAKIILDHVYNGLALGKKHNLPKEIIAFIEEHHGTTMVSYFYYAAKEMDSTVSESDFKYKIRKPQSIETAIVMIADSCEAATRSLSNKTSESIEVMVNNIIDGKIKERQFSECDISFLQIEIIKDELIRNLNSIYHDRIEYPKETTNA